MVLWLLGSAVSPCGHVKPAFLCVLSIYYAHLGTLGLAMGFSELTV
jgi:hypothetical protein